MDRARVSLMYAIRVHTLLRRAVLEVSGAMPLAGPGIGVEEVVALAVQFYDWLVDHDGVALDKAIAYHLNVKVYTAVDLLATAEVFERFLHRSDPVGVACVN